MNRVIDTVFDNNFAAAVLFSPAESLLLESERFRYQMAKDFTPSSRNREAFEAMTDTVGNVPPQAVELEEAVLGALEVVKDDEWLKECHLWLYRGAWMEWDLGMVDMAVPLSPDELIMKRHAIYRHLSQKDIMPFPGSDPREFWQRAEERTQNTAQLYDRLGMAEYQAIEVFVKMF